MTAAPVLAEGVHLVALPYPSTRRPDQNPFLHAFGRAVARHGVPVTVIAPQRVPTRSLAPGRDTVDGIEVWRPRFVSPGARRPVRGVRVALSHRAFAAAATRVAVSRPPPSFYWGHFLRPSGATAVALGRRQGRPAFIALGEAGWPASTQAFSVAANAEVLRSAAGVVAVSAEAAARARDDHGVPPDRLAVFPNAVDTDRFAPGDRRRAREALDLDPDGFVVAFVGRLDDNKGAGRVAVALDRLGGDVTGLFVGHGARPRPARARDRVGPVAHDRVPLHLQAADVFVLPSRAEGCPNAVIEALACGLPVVVSDRTFMREVVDEDAACFVDPERPEAIADALRALRDDPERRARLARAARLRATRVSLDDRAAAILEWVAPRVADFRP